MVLTCIQCTALKENNQLAVSYWDLEVTLARPVILFPAQIPNQYSDPGEEGFEKSFCEKADLW